MADFGFRTLVTDFEFWTLMADFKFWTLVTDFRFSGRFWIFGHWPILDLGHLWLIGRFGH